MSHGGSPASAECDVTQQPASTVKNPISQPLHSDSALTAQCDSAVMLAPTSKMINTLAELEAAESVLDALDARFGNCAWDKIDCNHRAELCNTV